MNLAEQQVYVCEVAVHLTTGLRYADKGPDNVRKLTDKFSRDIKYARKYLRGYKQHFMLWSPIVKNTKGNPENNPIRHLEEMKANIKERFDIDIECIVNQKFQECLSELRNYAKKQTKALQCPLLRMMQIEEYLNGHLTKLINR